MSRRTVLIRSYPDVKEKIKDISRELSTIQKSDVKSAEVLRRAMAIPDITDILKRDAELKRRLNRR